MINFHRFLPVRGVSGCLKIMCAAGLFLPTVSAADAVYQPSTVITGIEFDMGTLRNQAPGNGARAPESDNWTITWADDGHQYTSFGDGVGFSTFNGTRASIGVARIEGDKDNYSAFDVFKSGSSSGGDNGKSEGIIAIGSDLWMFWDARVGTGTDGTGSGTDALIRTDLFKSTDKGVTWVYQNVRWDSNDWGANGWYAPTFLQFGQAYMGARDAYVYAYLNEDTGDGWQVHTPGGISLMRVPVGELSDESAYEYFTGVDGANNPSWSSDVNDRETVFFDPVNGNMRTSVSYNAPLGRYILTTQQVTRFMPDAHIGIYEAPEPWGPWSTVIFDRAQVVGPNLNTNEKTVYWNFSNKWLSADGKDFVMVYTGDGPDEWGTVEGRFLTNGVVMGASPQPPGNLTAN